MGEYQSALYQVVTPAMGALAVVLNVIEIGFIVRRRKTWRLGTIYLLNLAVSDVIVGLTMIFLKSMHPFMKRDLKDDMVAKEIYNIIRYYFIRLSLFVSVFNLVVLVLDRVWAIAKPFSHRKKTPSFAMKACLFVWILSMICVTSTFCMVRFYGESVQQYYDLVFPVVTYLTTLVFTICYIVIFRKIRNSQTVRKQSTVMSRNQRNANLKKNVELKFLKLAFKTVIVFVVCWIPFSTCTLLRACGSSCGGTDVKSSLFVLAFFNSLMNPFVYFTHIGRDILRSMRQVLSRGTKRAMMTSITSSPSEETSLN